MNWGKIKTVIIILMLAVNLFFVYNIYIQHRNIYYINEKTIQAACDLLKADNIMVSADIIPDKKLSLSILESVFERDYYDTVVSKISGTENHTKRIINNGVEFNIARNNDIYIFSDTDVLYMKYISNDFGGKNLNNVNVEDYTEMNSGRLQSHVKTIKDYLMWQKDGQSGVNVYDITAVKGYYDEAGDRYFIYCVQTIDSQLVNECEFVAVIHNGIVQYLEGKLINNEIFRSHHTALIDQVNILFMEKSDILSNHQTEETAGIFNITALSSQYYINWNQERDIMFLIPAWMIMYENGDTVIRDAVNGSVY
jgi:Uncharacterized protein conserved in bacteria